MLYSNVVVSLERHLIQHRVYTILNSSVFQSNPGYRFDAHPICIILGASLLFTRCPASTSLQDPLIFLSMLRYPKNLRVSIIQKLL